MKTNLIIAKLTGLLPLAIAENQNRNKAYAVVSAQIKLEYPSISFVYSEFVSLCAAINNKQDEKTLLKMAESTFTEVAEQTYTNMSHLQQF